MNPYATRQGALLYVYIPSMRLVSELNAREHWSSRSRRAKSQRESTTMILMTSVFRNTTRVRFPLQVTIVRVAPRKLDTDNLAASAKHVRDGIADWLGINDATESVTWQVDQRRGLSGEYSVEIWIKETET